MNHLVLLRHGQSQWNADNRFTGFVDVELSEKGVAEAHKAGELMRGLVIDRVFCSTLQRAIETLEIALTDSACNDHLRDDGGWIITKHDDLRERDYGDLAGLNKTETAKKFGKEQVQIWRRSYDIPPPGGESLADVVTRVRPYYEAEILPELQAGKTLLIGSHGNTVRALLVIFGIHTPEDIFKVEIPTGVPIIFELEDGRPRRYSFLSADAVQS